MKNRIASLFLVFALTMSLCTFAVARDNPIAVQSGGAERFTDVPASHWAYSYIDKVVGSGLFNGKTATTFEPSSAMTRSQFVMVMARMEGMSSLEGQYTTTKFPDVTPTRRAAGPIAWASAEEQGFVLGFGDGTFKPDSPITRGQFAALIHRYIVAKRYTNLLVVDPEPAQFTDVGSVSPAFTADVEYARVHGLLTGYSDGTVRASNPITRAAIAAILARFLDLVTDSGYTPLMDGPVSGGDNGDSNDTPPVEVPTEYKDIKLVEKNGDHGTTSIVSVTRDGVQVTDPDDLQEGDIVTIRHDPDKGYVASIRVKDSKNKSVKPVTTKGNLSTFKMPAKNLPVTVTVTYTKQSSGGGGGGSSGGGGYTPSYYLSVKANVVPDVGGTVFLTQSVPTAVPATAQATATMAFTSIYENVAGFAVFVPNDGYEFDSATATGKTFTANDYKKVTLTKANSTDTVDAIYVQISGTGNLDQSNPPAISVTGTFKVKGGGEQPTDKTTWTVSASGTGAYFNVAKTQQTTDATQSTATQKFEVSNTSESVYVAVTPQAGYEFGSALPTVSGGTYDPNPVTSSPTLRVYKITKDDFVDKADNATTFTMNLPEKQPEQTDEENLEYKVELKIVGNGTVALKAGNETLNEAKKEVTIKMTKSEYTSRYPDRTPKDTKEYVLPVFLTSMPVADKGYKYDGKVDYNGKERDAKVFAANADTAGELNNQYFAVEPNTGETYTVKVKFDELVSYGYNLTIIGNETVTADFNGTSVPYKGNADNTPKTYSSGLIVTDSNKLTLTLDNGFKKSGDAYVKGDYTAEKPIVKGVSTDGKTTETTADYSTEITLNKNALTDIVVEIHKTNRGLYKFTVNVEAGSTGKVTVKPESGHILNEAGTAEATDTVIESGGGKTFSAYEDTVITIVPKTDDKDKVKVKSITVTPTASYTRDVMATAGYSFQLKSGDIKAVVTFGEFVDYSFLLKAPYDLENGPDTHSKNIQKDNTLEEILYSLNNGQRDRDFMKDESTGIENEFGMPATLNKFVKAYLKNQAGKKKDGSSATGAQLLEESLQDAIKPNITTIVPSIVEAKKADLKAQEDTLVKAPMKEAMETKQADYEKNPIAITGAAKTELLNTVLDADQKQLLSNGTIKESDFEIKVVPVISEAKAAELGIDGQSVQKQMEALVGKYLSAIRVKSGYEEDLEPTVTVTPAESEKTHEVVISAVVSTKGGWPTLDPSVTMTSYLDQLNVMVAVSVTQGSNNLTATPKLVSSGEVKGYNFTEALEPLMKDVDEKVSKAWDETFKAMLKDNKLPIDMSMVLAQDDSKVQLLDPIVQQMIQPPSVTLTEKIGSLGDGEMTKSAIMNIYRDFVVFDNAKPTDCLLYLKTNDESDKSYVVAKIDTDKNFVLMYDFEKILRDTYFQKGTPSKADMVPFEQLADLILALRNGISEDIRTNATNGQTSQSVIAALIEGRIAHVKAVKWGKETTNWTEVERKEISNLLAAFLMNSETSDKMGDLWADFENSGYTSVEFKLAIDASKRPGVSALVTAFNDAADTSGSKLTVGFKVDQNLKK